MEEEVVDEERNRYRYAIRIPVSVWAEIMNCHVFIIGCMFLVKVLQSEPVSLLSRRV